MNYTYCNSFGSYQEQAVAHVVCPLVPVPGHVETSDPGGIFHLSEPLFIFQSAQRQPMS